MQKMNFMKKIFVAFLCSMLINTVISGPMPNWDNITVESKPDSTQQVYILRDSSKGKSLRQYPWEIDHWSHILPRETKRALEKYRELYKDFLQVVGSFEYFTLTRFFYYEVMSVENFQKANKKFWSDVEKYKNLLEDFPNPGEMTTTRRPRRTRRTKTTTTTTASPKSSTTNKINVGDAVVINSEDFINEINNIIANATPTPNSDQEKPIPTNIESIKIMIGQTLDHLQSLMEKINGNNVTNNIVTNNISSTSNLPEYDSTTTTTSTSESGPEKKVEQYANDLQLIDPVTGEINQKVYDYLASIGVELVNPDDIKVDTDINDKPSPFPPKEKVDDQYIDYFDPPLDSNTNGKDFDEDVFDNTDYVKNDDGYITPTKGPRRKRRRKVKKGIKNKTGKDKIAEQVASSGVQEVAGLPPLIFGFE